MADEFKKILDNELAFFKETVFLQRLGNGAVAVVRDRTLKGQFIEGPGRYSEKPFARPLGGLTNTLYNKIVAQAKGPDADNFKIFQTKRGSTWVVIKEGYRKFRELAGRQSGHVDFTFTGRMMRNLCVVNVLPGKSIEIGFNRPDENQKALWHNVEGAGKGKTKRVFMKLTSREVDKIIKAALNSTKG